ncbi:MAG TPA: thermonuclease family protein, partial [Verrucomicrobiales bacterium]|nr:thermonuclease family protein [Verrucomicrobiales bacterium]
EPVETVEVRAAIPHGKNAAAVSVIDGDTLSVSMDGHTATVRIDGIDAPDRGQPFDTAAVEALSSLVKNRVLTINFTGRDRDGVQLAGIRAGGLDLGATLLRQGFGWYREERDACIDCAVFADAEAEAQLLRRGLWKDNMPVSPWEWRKKRAGAAMASAAH